MGRKITLIISMSLLLITGNLYGITLRKIQPEVQAVTGDTVTYQGLGYSQDDMRIYGGYVSQIGEYGFFDVTWTESGTGIIGVWDEDQGKLTHFIYESVIDYNMHLFRYTHDGMGNLTNRIYSFTAIDAPEQKSATLEEMVEDYEKSIAEPEEEQNDDNLSSNTLINLYPNPTSGIVNIDLSGIGVSEGKYSIFSIHGDLLKEGNITQEIMAIDISRFSSGTYLFKIQADSFLENIQVVKL